MNKDKWNIFMVIGKVYALSILESLFQSPKRFTDLSQACPIEKTRSKRLKELQENNLIEVIVKKINKRNFVHYKLTKEGEELFKKAMDI